jgi:hypothetical protein
MAYLGVSFELLNTLNVGGLSALKIVDKSRILIHAWQTSLSSYSLKGNFVEEFLTLTCGLNSARNRLFKEVELSRPTLDRICRSGPIPIRLRPGSCAGEAGLGLWHSHLSIQMVRMLTPQVQNEVDFNVVRFYRRISQYSLIVCKKSRIISGV